MTPDTPITIQFPGSAIAQVETTWGEFMDANDEDTVDDVLDQLGDGHHYAEIGGGAAPLVWVFA